jgi:hypothetical protein
VRVRGWRIGQRLAIGALSFGALATAAAATGLLEQLAIPVPSAQSVWASISGTATAAPAPAAAATPATLAAGTSQIAVVLEGPIDTPEELGEVFRRIDQVRNGRREERRAIIDQRITSEIERRRAAGLRVPTPEEEARLRERIDAGLDRRDQRVDAQVASRREALARKVENGEALTSEDFTGRSAADHVLRERLREMRRLTPAERREVLRNLPPEERRALIEAARQRRGAAVPQAAPVPTPAPSPEALPGE